MGWPWTPNPPCGSVSEENLDWSWVYGGIDGPDTVTAAGRITKILSMAISKECARLVDQPGMSRMCGHRGGIGLAAEHPGKRRVPVTNQDDPSITQ